MKQRAKERKAAAAEQHGREKETRKPKTSGHKDMMESEV